MPYQSIFSGKNTATLPSGKANRFAGDFQPGQYAVKNQPKQPNPDTTPTATSSAVIKVPATPKSAGPNKSLLGTLSTYGKALITSPVSTVKDIATGQRINSVNNGALILQRAPLSKTAPIAKAQAGNIPAGTRGQLDHTIPLELGGTNSSKNLKLIPQSQDQANNSVENYLGSQLKANKINAQQAKQLILDYKAGKVSGQDTVNKAQNMPQGKSLISKIGGTTKSFGNAAIAGERVFATGIARDLPGGSNDLKANVKASDQAMKNIKQVHDLVASGKMKPEAAKKIIQQNANDAGITVKDTADIIAKLPTKGQIALGAASTAADILTGGKLSGLNIAKGTSLTSKVVRGSTQAGAFGTAGALNAGAAGGTKKQVAENFVAGAVLPGVLKIAGKGVSKGAEAVVGNQATKDLVANTKTKSLLDAVQTPKVVNADVATAKSINTIMSKIRTPSRVIQDIKAEGEATVAKQAEAEKVAQQTQKTVEANTKLDNQIELINAKKTDGKFTNVDKVKIKQLEAQKVPVEGSMPKVSEATPAVNKPNVPEADGVFITKQDKPVAGTLPMERFKTDIKPSQNSVDAKGVNKYIKQIQAGERPQVIVDKTNGINRVIDGHTKLAAYEHLGFKDVPVVDRNGRLTQPTQGVKLDSGAIKSQTEKPITTVPIEQPQIRQPEIGQSKLAASTEQKAIDKKLTQGFEGKPEYAKVNTKDQAAHALELHKTDPVRAERIALGKELPPGDLLPESVYTVVENHALKTGNVDLLRRLATESSLSGEATGMGQRIRMLGERDPDSAVAAMRKLAETRKAAAEKKLGKPVTKAVSDTVKEIRVAKPKVAKETFASFVDSLKC